MSTSEVCYTLPPVVTEGYTVKGTYETIAGLKTCMNLSLSFSLSLQLFARYFIFRSDIAINAVKRSEKNIYAYHRLDITGSTSAKIGIIDVYDIFGLSNQTLQGADLLASSLDAVLLIPDFFKGESVKKEWMSLPPEEKKPLWDKFMAESASIPAAAEALVKVVQESKTKFPSVAKWGAYGLCWGAKVGGLFSISINSISLHNSFSGGGLVCLLLVNLGFWSQSTFFILFCFY
jgi:hypothetical protein